MTNRSEICHELHELIPILRSSFKMGIAAPLFFLFPFLPDDLVCFLIGLSPLSIPFMLALAALAWAFWRNQAGR